MTSVTLGRPHLGYHIRVALGGEEKGRIYAGWVVETPLPEGNQESELVPDIKRGRPVVTM
jgi:hypothetical protein